MEGLPAASCTGARAAAHLRASRCGRAERSILAHQSRERRRFRGVHAARDHRLERLRAPGRVVRPQCAEVDPGLKMLPDTTLERLPRMADFALWATACETALWPPGTFWSAYCGNRDEAVENVIEADPVAAAVRAMMEERTEWTGTATDLLGALAESAGERVAKSKTWPASPRALSGRLRQAATFLRKIGIEIAFDREGRARTRIIRISCVADDTGAAPSRPSAPSAKMVDVAYGKGSRAARVRTVSPPADANGESAGGPAVRENSVIPADADDADGPDAKSLDQSGGWRALI